MGYYSIVVWLQTKQKKNETEEMKLPGNVIYIGQWITTEFQPLAKGNFLRVQLVMHQPQN